MWCWSCCFRGLEKSCILHAAIPLAALMKKKKTLLLLKIPWQLLSLRTMHYTRRAFAIDPIMQIPRETCFFGGQFCVVAKVLMVYLAQLGYKLNVKVKLFRHPPIFLAIFLKFGRIMAIENHIILALYIASKKKSTRLQIPRENPKSTHI
jgi:hypothetical protein